MNERGWDGLCQVAYGDGFDQGHKKGYESGHARGTAATEAKIITWLRGLKIGGYDYSAEVIAQMIERGDHAQPEPAKGEADDLSQV